MLDDFGTGYSSLAHLQQLPVDALKIDRSFVARMLDDANAALIARATIEMGRALGLRVVAEGVETRTRLDALAALGRREAQGFLHRPATAGRRVRGLVPRARPAGRVARRRSASACQRWNALPSLSVQAANQPWSARASWRRPAAELLHLRDRRVDVVGREVEARVPTVVRLHDRGAGLSLVCAIR